ncbi:alpha/beta hydrolase [Erythrobacter litoralis]|nr:alpha/beta hydrolase [Erythrobacter litoralis]
MLLAACATPGTGGPGSPARYVEIEQMAAVGLPDQRLTIWLPPGYDDSGKRYPVLYMHDGHNLFDPAVSNFDKVWAADAAMLEAMDAGVEPHIIVGIWAQGEDRYRQYLPQSLYEMAYGTPRAAMDAMIEDAPLGAAYLDWLAGPLRTWIDATYRTKTGRDSTAIIGSSMGGLMSCYAFLERPDIYGRAGCISSHWSAADPEAVGNANSDLIALWDMWFADRLGEPDGRKVWMDHGTETLDAYYAPYQRAIDARFRAQGWREGRDFRSEVYNGAAHEENAWAARLPQVFIWLLAKE